METRYSSLGDLGHNVCGPSGRRLPDHLPELNPEKRIEQTSLKDIIIFNISACICAGADIPSKKG